MSNMTHHGPFSRDPQESASRADRAARGSHALPCGSRSHSRLRAWLLACAAALVLVAGGVPAGARAGLENICTIAGQQEQKLIGLGLVVGLKGTGDGGKYAPMINALGSALAQLNNPASGPADLKDASNVALVLVEATVPANGIRRGQRIDCYVNSIGAAKNLRGGRLMIAPLGSQLV